MSVLLNRNESIEIMLTEIERKAWEEFDRYSENELEEDFDVYKVSTFLNEGENNENFMVIINKVNDKLYKVPFEYNGGDKSVTFGEMVEMSEVFLESRVEQEIKDMSIKSFTEGDYEDPVIDIVMYKQLYDEYPEITIKNKEKELTAGIVNKEDEKRIVEGAVLVPGEEDHDGDTVDKEKIEEVAHNWMLKYRNTDLQHTLQNVAQPIESYILKEDREVENVDGESYIVPKGSWILGVKVEDDDTWEAVKNNELTGFSIMGIPSTLKSKNNVGENIAFKKTTLQDIEDAGYDWTVPFVSLVDEPAVPKGKLYSIKNKKEAEEEEQEVVEKSDNNFFEKIKSIFKNNNQKDETFIKIGDNKYSIKEGRELNSENREKLESVLAVLAEMLGNNVEIEVVEINSDGTENRRTADDLLSNKSQKEDELDMDKKELEEVLNNFKSDFMDEVDSKIDEKLETEKEKEDVEEEETEEVEKSNDNEEFNEEVEALKEKLDELEEKLENVKGEKDNLEEFVEAVKSKFKTTKSNKIVGQDGEEEEEVKTTEKNRYSDRDRFGRKK